MEERGLKISRQKAEYLGAMNIKTQRSMYRETLRREEGLKSIFVIS